MSSLERTLKCRRKYRAALLGWIVGLASIASADVKVGDVFPSLESNDIAVLGSGRLPKLQDKVVLVDFWASWCAPCKASFPVMGRLHTDYTDRGLVIVAVGIDEKAAAATAFWKKMNPPFASVHDRTQSLVKAVAVPTMPTSYLIGRDGRVRYIHQGFHGETTDRELRKQIEGLLAEKG